MKITPFALAVLAAIAACGGPLAASAQDAPASAATSQALTGLPIADMMAFMSAQGLVMTPVAQNGEQWFSSAQDGETRWVVFFQSCEAQVCSDVQFSLGFANAGITLEGVNRWNRERRFLKAFYEPGTTPEAPPAAAVQYDVFLNPTLGVEQLGDHLSIWRGLTPQFGAVVLGVAAAPTAPPSP